MRKKDIKGFTLVELLAVIVILAIIMIIATMNVGKVITRSRTQSFESNMDLAVKNAKRILDTGDTLTTEKLRESLGYSANEYDFDVKKVPDGYLLQLISTSTGKFKNVDFSTISKNNNYIYEENVKGENGRNKIGLKISIDGNTVNITEDSIEEKIVKEELPDGCTNFTKKDTYEVGDVISFCNYYAEFNGTRGKSEDFRVIKDNGDTVTMLAEHNLMVGKYATTSYSILFSGLQASSNSSSDFYVPFAIADGLEEIPGCTSMYGRCCHYGYWYKDSTVGVYNEKSNVYNYVNNYVKLIKENFGKMNVEGGILTFEELGLDLLEYRDITVFKKNISNIRNRASKSNLNREWIFNSRYWISEAKNEKRVYNISRYGTLPDNCFDDQGAAGVRPVITISKSEL